MTIAANRALRNGQIIADELKSHGSVCACGCHKKLEPGYHWHHLPTSAKVAGISELRRATVVVLRCELGKCVPMTAECHLQGQHGH